MRADLGLDLVERHRARGGRPVGVDVEVHLVTVVQVVGGGGERDGRVRRRRRRPDQTRPGRLRRLQDDGGQGQEAREQTREPAPSAVSLQRHATDRTEAFRTLVVQIANEA
jgi:hypothetical protein